MNTPDKGFEELCAELLDGTLGEDDHDRLLALLREEPERVQELQRHLMVSGALCRQNPAYDDERFVSSMSTHLHQLGDEPILEFPTRVRRRITRQRQRRMAWALAACLTLAAVPLALHYRSITPDPAPAVATATLLRTGESETAQAEAIEAGRNIDLESGLMRLEFGNGAVVAVEAPARFRVASADLIELESGNLNAWCPETAHGFRVTTHSATLTDLGTTFGVSATKDGFADFVVLEGEVEVSAGGKQRKLLEGKAVRATALSSFEDVAFETAPFRRTWPVTSGILATTGEVIPAPPNTPKMVASYEDDEHIIVIPERRAFRLPDRLPADITTPGEYGGGTGNTLKNSQPIVGGGGQRGRSYLLRYNPVGLLDFGVFVQFEGTVTFDRPILGIITSTPKLDHSDPIASAAPLPDTPEPHGMRGLEAGPRTKSDYIKLSESRRTITVAFNAGESIDEIRVITESH